jgi:NTP pyrophosphatase (non-canonical NTP hydrolase)
MFGTVFAANLRHLSLTDVGLHLMEELGEVSDAMVRMYSYVQKTFVAGEPNWRQFKLEAQLADVFSWLFSLIEKLSRLEGERRSSGSRPSLAFSVLAAAWC